MIFPQAMKTSVKAAAEHRLMNSLSAFYGPNQEHAEQIGVGPVTVQGGAGLEISYFGGPL